MDVVLDCFGCCLERDLLRALPASHHLLESLLRTSILPKSKTLNLFQKFEAFLSLKNP